MEPTLVLPLTAIQERVAAELASGVTITDASASAGLNRVTVYRWLKTRPDFAAAVQQARAEFILARRDELHYISNRALETVVAVLDDATTSAAVRLRAAMFILQRSQMPDSGWCMPAPLPETTPVLDSVVIEKECDRLACIDGLEFAEPEPPDAPAEEPDARQCNEMQPEIQNFEAEQPALRSALPSCPVPGNVLRNRSIEELYRESIHLLAATKNGTLASILRGGPPK